MAKINEMLKGLREHTGKKPVIYTDINFHEDVLEGELNDHPFWLRSTAAPLAIEDAVPTSFGDLAAGVALVDGGDTFAALRLKAAEVDAHALGQHEVALFGPVGAQPFEVFRGVQGVVRHVHALPDLTVLGPGLLLAGGGVYDRYPLAVLVI